MNHLTRWLAAGMASAGLHCAAAQGGLGETLRLVDLGPGFALSAVETGDTVVTLDAVDGASRLRVDSGHASRWPYVAFTSTNGAWDLDRYGQIKVDVVNLGTRALRLGLRADNPGGNGTSNSIQHIDRFGPGEAGTLAVALGSMGCRIDPPVNLVGMRGRPGIGLPSLTNVVRILVYVEEPRDAHAFTLANVRADGTLQRFTPESFFPVVDEFGQYRHRDWPGKVHDAADFSARREAEEQDLAAHPGPTDRNAYGGWTAGPQREATGFFRVEKIDGKWWFVDPEGRLFWSYGMNCVGLGDLTPVTDREHYFAGLEDSNSVLQAYRGVGHWAPVGYYTNRLPYAFVNHFEANLARKDGAGWRDVAVDRAHRRLRSWGLNTIGNWSWRAKGAPRRTSYVGTVDTRSAALAGSKGYWRPFPDVFDPSFVAILRAGIQETGAAGDPWCVGFFVDNELSWDEELSLALATLASPAGQSAKHELERDLQARYGSIADLNKAWGTAYDSWDGWREATATQHLAGATADLRAFAIKTAETYFRTIKQVLAEEAPGQLYLGCRFASTNAIAVRAAAQYCDVVSFNSYKDDVSELDLPKGVTDRPIIIGEFHFGAMDRGLFHPGLTPARDQAHAAACTTRYLQSALHQPRIIGAHWFQYRDQPTLGRGDGENYPCGMVDVCDTPQAPLVKTSRQFGATLYERRLGLPGNGASSRQPAQREASAE